MSIIYVCMRRAGGVAPYGDSVIAASTAMLAIEPQSRHYVCVAICDILSPKAEKYEKGMINIMKLHDRKPDINNIYKVFRGEPPSRPTLFELFLNRPLYERLAQRTLPADSADPGLDNLLLVIDAYAAAGYDYATSHGCDISFKNERSKPEGKDTLSLNQGYVITDEASFEAYEWPVPEKCDYSRLEKAEAYMPEGMKLMVMGPGGVLENAIGLTGYDNLCFMLYENPGLAKAVFDKVGSCLLRYYEIAAQYPAAGFIMSNDDWGFKSQTFLSPEHMREYVLPWHKKIVETAHARNLPAVLHSCGNLEEVMDDVIDYCGFDAKHSYEDIIMPVEDVYEKYHGRIAVLGGVDVDYIINRPDSDITARCRGMLKRAEGRGGYALGTGNSVPEYVPQDKYLTMIKAALEY